MKEKKNKKFYNFTEKQKRRDRSNKPKLWSVPKDYRQMFNREREAKAKQVFIKILKGYKAEFDLDKKDVGWYYW
jgi:hypothetical protein